MTDIATPIAAILTYGGPKGASLKRTRTVLNLSEPTDGGLFDYMVAGWEIDDIVIFETDIEDDSDPTHFTHAVIFPETAWEDMGRPETITVTIRPGDRLND